MDRFSVGRAIAHAYGFLFARVLTVVTLSWVAAAFFGALRFFLFSSESLLHRPIAPEVAALHAGGALLTILLAATVAVSLTRAALGEHGEWALAHFVIGARELKLFAAFIRLIVVIAIVFALAAGAVIGAAWGVKAVLAQWPAAAATGWPVERIADGIAAAIAVVAALYATLRLSFFLLAVGAVEDKARLARAWELGGGNVLRILAVTLAIAVPVYALLIAGEYAILGPQLGDIGRALLSGTAQDPAPFLALVAAHAAPISCFAAVMLVVTSALHGGAGASAYADLTGRVLGNQQDSAAEAVAAGGLLAAAAHGHSDHSRDDHGHGHDNHGHHGHDDHGHGGHDEHAHGGHDSHGHDSHGHDAHGHDDHGHGGHDHAGHGHDSHDDHGHGEHGHDNHGHDDHGHNDHAHGDHGHGGHDDHGHGGHGHDDDHGQAGHAHDDHGHGGHAHDDHGHDDHGHEKPHGHHHASATLELTEADEAHGHAPHTRVLEHA